jgi:hypothetical protein
MQLLDAQTQQGRTGGSNQVYLSLLKLFSPVRLLRLVLFVLRTEFSQPLPYLPYARLQLRIRIFP